MLALKAFLFLSIVLLFSMPACRTWQATLAQQKTPDCPATRVTPAGAFPGAVLEHLDPDGELAAPWDYQALIRSKLMAENFDELERIAAELRDSKARFPAGAWKLDKFYNGASDPVRFTESPETEWQPQLKRVKQWVNAHPHSLTARIALGQALVDYAWTARGGGYANTVTEERWVLFRERLRQASEVLGRVGEERRIDPKWHCVMLKLARSEGWSRDRYDQVFEEGVAAEPTFRYLYFEKATNLMPRWHGQPGDLELFMHQSQQRLGGKEGSAMYYLVGGSIFDFMGQSLFTDTKICWETMKQGFVDLDSLYGINQYEMNRMIRICGIAGEKPMCRWLYTRLGDRWDPDEWRDRKSFEDVRTWAFS